MQSGPQSQPIARPFALDLVGQWRARMSFESGDFAMVEGLEFMCVFNLGGTMTEVVDDDAAPPVPPPTASARRPLAGFEVKYEFYLTATPHAVEELTAGGGWLPAGLGGAFLENIRIADNGGSCTPRP